ncbi:MAG: hypothetical protein R3182_00840 [Draconibacterium sp.]|nr:hypothetical protein [Draconibacterium sp.]
MKTRINQLIAITIFAIIIFSGNTNAKGTELPASSHEIIENSLELEDWMFNSDYWNETKITANYVTEIDENLELEDWMLKEYNWDVNLKNVSYEVAEQQLELENWMIDRLVWMVPEITEAESMLTVERWMEKENIWIR